MKPDLEQLILSATKEAQNSQPSRAMSLVVTKLEEAMFWLKYQEQERADSTRHPGRSA